jgi:hypothetical protein
LFGRHTDIKLNPSFTAFISKQKEDGTKQDMVLLRLLATQEAKTLKYAVSNPNSTSK